MCHYHKFILFWNFICFNIIPDSTKARSNDVNFIKLAWHRSPPGDHDSKIISGPHRQIGYFCYNYKQTLQKKTKPQNKSSSRKPRRRSPFSAEPPSQGLVKQTVVWISNIACHLGHHPPKILSFCSHAGANPRICTQWLWWVPILFMMFRVWLSWFY